MALLNLMNLEGFSIDYAYWRVGSLEWNTNERLIVRIRIDGYASQEAYDEGNTAIRSFYKEISLEDPALQDIVNNIKSYCYSNIKQQDEFSSALDV